jgi:catechol 2,3-dioxygenase-like lactoylglutathione lyase family enzyme
LRFLVRSGRVPRDVWAKVWSGMHERVTANLPARGFDETAAFYEALGFVVRYRDEAWMIMTLGDLEIEFFPHPALNPASSWFSAGVRVRDADRLHAEWKCVGLPEVGIPRMASLEDVPPGLRMFALVDPDGSLLRCIS